MTSSTRVLENPLRPEEKRNDPDTGRVSLLSRITTGKELAPRRTFVYGVQGARKGGVFERLSGQAFYALFNALSSHPIPANQTTARLMTRRSAPILASIATWLLAVQSEI